jgi:hypothetical protein
MKKGSGLMEDFEGMPSKWVWGIPSRAKACKKKDLSL